MAASNNMSAAATAMASSAFALYKLLFLLLLLQESNLVFLRQCRKNRRDNTRHQSRPNCVVAIGIPFASLRQRVYCIFHMKSMLLYRVPSKLSFLTIYIEALNCYSSEYKQFVKANNDKIKSLYNLDNISF